MSRWSELLNLTGKSVILENCHQGGLVPGQRMPGQQCTGAAGDAGDCPYHVFRTSDDIYNSWEHIINNINSVTPFLSQADPAVAPRSRPGQWAYPDMLEIGNLGCQGQKSSCLQPNNTKRTEDRSMFGMWCIVSAPLVLSFDVTVGEVVDAVWPILSNSEAVSINQRWEGSPGRLLLTDRKGLQEPNAAGFVLFPGQLGQARGWQNVPGDTGPVGWQVGDCVDEWTGGACSEHYMVLNIENMTLGEADAWCGDEPLCGGFSYRNGTTGSAAVDEKVREIYFKGADEVFFMDGCGNSPVASPPWSSHIKESRAPPFAVSPGSDADESTSGVQVWVKEFAQSEPPQIAVLLVNVGQTELPAYSVPLADLPAPFDTAGGGVRDVWARQDLAPIAAGGELLFKAVEPHGSRFLLLTATSSSTAPPRAAPPLQRRVAATGSHITSVAMYLQ